MVAMLKELLASKKFFTALVAGVCWLVGRLGLHVDPEVLGPALFPLLTFIVSQGIADRGKSAATIGVANDADKVALAAKANELIVLNTKLRDSNAVEVSPVA